MPRVTFIQPCMGRYPGTKYVRTWQMQPLAIGVLAALTPPEWERAFYDDRLEAIDYDRPTDLAAITVETFTARRSYQIAGEFRRRNIPVVMGGYHPTLCTEEALEHATAICIGPAEGVWKDVLSDALRGQLARIYRAEPGVVGAVAPDRSIFHGKNYLHVTLLETSRGCRFRCGFCSVTAFYGATHSRRPVQEVVQELRALGAKLVFFVDDNIVADFETARELFRALKPLRVRWVSQGSLDAASDPELLRLMAESGCQGLLVGFESLSSTSLATLAKGVNRRVDYEMAVSELRRHGIMTYGTFMFGLPGETRELVDDTLAFAQRNKLWIGAFAHLTPFPGTPLYELCRKEDRLVHQSWWLNEDYRFGQAPFKPWSTGAAELEKLCYDARRRFFSWPSILRRGLDFSANASSPIKAGVYLAANVMLKRELSRRRGIPLGLPENRTRAGRPAYGKIAGPADNAAICALLRQTPMPGPIRLTYLREPDFLESLSVEGRFNQALIGLDGSTSRVFAVGCRSVKTAFLNGKPQPAGYLSTLRMAEGYRGRNYLARGYRMFREQHKDGRTQLYLMTITDGNGAASRLLTSGRAGLPFHHDFGRYHCLAVSLRQRLKESRDHLRIRPARPEDVPGIIEFWNREGSRRQFFPLYSADDLLQGIGLLRGLNTGDILLAYSEGELVGTVAAWDQSAFRQVMVNGYSRPLSLVRRPYNVAARILGYPIFPPSGSRLSYFNLSLVCIKDNDRQVFSGLLAALAKGNRSGHDFFLAGFHERDPLLSVVKPYRHYAYGSRLYVVCWEDGEPAFRNLDDRVPYLELGSL